MYTGNRQLSLNQETALGPYRYVGTSKHDTGGNGEPVYMKIQDDSNVVSFIHKYDIYGWQGWQCRLVSRSVILRLTILHLLLIFIVLIYCLISTGHSILFLGLRLQY